MGSQRKKILGDMAVGMATITSDVQTLLDYTFQSFINNKEDMIKNNQDIVEKVDEQVAELAYKVPVLELDEREEITKVLSIINSLESMKYNVIKVLNQTLAKINEGILFTNKAVSELEGLFEAVLSLVENLGDIFITENQVLIKHTMERVREIENSAQQYATEHEERLIAGECLPKASTMYLLTLDSLRDILWHVKTIARELAY